MMNVDQDFGAGVGNNQRDIFRLMAGEWTYNLHLISTRFRVIDWQLGPLEWDTEYFPKYLPPFFI